MAIQFYLTDVGRTAALNADNLGLDLQIKNIAVGDAANGGLYDASIEAATMTALDNELERYLVNGGEIEPITHTLRFTVNLNSTITADIYEIGLFDENNVLFAVASSTTTPLVQLINEVITIITFGFSLDDVDNITLMLDVNSPLAVTLMNQHTAHEHPHAQYKRINDDTERLKVANATDSKDAVNKEQLDAEATARSNADTNLQNTKAAKNGDNTQRFKVANAVDADDAVAKNQLDTVANVLPTKANKNGDAAETFNVADGTSGSHAVNKSQLDALALNSIMPVGSIVAYAGFAAPVGWLECNGQSTSGYPALTAVVGLNVPDLRGEFIRGWSHGRIGVDESRALMSFQEGTSVGTQDAGYGATQIKNSDGDDGTYSVSSDSGVTGSYGGTWKRVRPRNIALMYIIKT